MTPDKRSWTPDLVVGGVIFVLGVLESGAKGGGLLAAFFVFGTAAAISLCRKAPGASLAVAWATCTLQVFANENILFIQLALAAVGYGSARWGSPRTVWLSGLSIPAASIVSVLYVGLGRFTSLDVEILKRLFDTVDSLAVNWQPIAIAVGMAILSLPWLAGLAVRFNARAQESRVHQETAEEEAARAQLESGQAREIARLRERQARMARDVHDVVGHSLAVILAQAESGQYLKDPTALQQTMANIATTARSSLQDVRQVLATTGEQPTVSRQGSLDELIVGVRSSGHDVRSAEVGTPQPLPPELAVVAFRVMQEMLTNAIKHGVRGKPVMVERHWDGELRIEVRNVIAPMETSSAGQGVDGMRRRLESVGGRLDVRRRDEADGATYTATAWVPVRAAS